MTIQIETTLTSGQLLNSSHLVPFISTTLCLTLATNVITTCTISPTPLLVHSLIRTYFSALIVFRIWKVRSKIGLGHLFNHNSPLTNVVIVLIESGLLYTLSIIILFGLYLASNNGQYGVSNSVGQKKKFNFSLTLFPD